AACCQSAAVFAQNFAAGRAEVGGIADRSAAPASAGRAAVRDADSTIARNDALAQAADMAWVPDFPAAARAAAGTEDDSVAANAAVQAEIRVAPADVVRQDVKAFVLRDVKI